MLDVIHNTAHLWHPTSIWRGMTQNLPASPFQICLLISCNYFPDVSTRKRKVFPATAARASNTTLLICCKHCSSNSHLEVPARDWIVQLSSTEPACCLEQEQKSPIRWCDRGAERTGQFEFLKSKCICCDDDEFKYTPRPLLLERLMTCYGTWPADGDKD